MFVFMSEPPRLAERLHASGATDLLRVSRRAKKPVLRRFLTFSPGRRRCSAVSAASDGRHSRCTIAATLACPRGSDRAAAWANSNLARTAYLAHRKPTVSLRSVLFAPVFGVPISNCQPAKLR